MKKLTQLIHPLLVVGALLRMDLSYAQSACCAGAGTGSSNFDVNEGLLTLNKKQWLLEGYSDFRSLEAAKTPAVTAPMDHSHMNHVHGTSSTTMQHTPLKSLQVSSIGLRYGLTNKWTLSAVLPYALLTTSKGYDQGLGDLILLGTCSIIKRTNFKMALQGGVELPTGEQKNSTFDNATVVVGSGSIDPMAGFLFSYRMKKFTVSGFGLYKQTTPGFEHNYYGSLSVQSALLNYQIAGQRLVADCDTTTLPKKFGCSAFVGYSGEWLDQIRENSIRDTNSGYYLGFATIGGTLSWNKWQFPLSFSLPIIQELNGNQNKNIFRFRIGIARFF